MLNASVQDDYDLQFYDNAINLIYLNAEFSTLFQLIHFDVFQRVSFFESVRKQ